MINVIPFPKDRLNTPISTKGKTPDTLRFRDSDLNGLRNWLWFLTFDNSNDPEIKEMYEDLKREIRFRALREPFYRAEFPEFFPNIPTYPGPEAA